MIANVISHTVLFGIAILFIGMKFISGESYFGLLSLDISLYVIVSVMTTFLTIFLIEILKRYAKLNNDASTALVFSTLFSIGAVLITVFTKSSHVGVDVIVGNLDLIHMDDLITGGFVFSLTVLFIGLFYKDLIILSFDGMITHFSRKSTFLLQFGFLFLTSLVITSGFRFIGIAPVLGLVIIPPVTASLYGRSVKELIAFSVIANIMVGTLAVVVSKFFYDAYAIGLSTSGLLVTLHFILFLVILGRKTLEVKA